MRAGVRRRRFPSLLLSLFPYFRISPLPSLLCVHACTQGGGGGDFPSLSRFLIIHFSLSQCLPPLPSSLWCNGNLLCRARNLLSFRRAFLSLSSLSSSLLFLSHDGNFFSCISSLYYLLPRSLAIVPCPSCLRERKEERGERRKDRKRNFFFFFRFDPLFDRKRLTRSV